MKDRIAAHPGRVKLTPVSGNIYDMEMADDPVEVGTALNKANLLTDATAAALAAVYNSTPDTPNEALALLAGAANIETADYVGTGTYGSEANGVTITFNHEPKLIMVLCTTVNASANGAGAQFPYSFVLAWGRAKQACQYYPNGIGQFASAAPREGVYWYACLFKLSNDYKTITWWGNESAQGQYNTSDMPYSVISFY